MRYGYFDDENREYVIQDPRTPMSWINYLGTSEYCGIISNNASGYAFHQSPRSRRLMRFRFNSIPMDRPGRYIYLRDEADGDFWSASWQPVAKPLAKYRTECRHGMGYTRFTSEYKGIKTSFRVFVPPDKPVEFWELEIENVSRRTRTLSLLPYVEWCFWNMDQDLTNFQYILYTCRMGYAKGIVDYSIRFFPWHEPKAFLASVLPVLDFDTDRDVFIGNYNDEGDPAAVKRGKCFNSIAVGGSPCASVRNRITLRPGQKKWTVYLVGIGDAKTDGRRMQKTYSKRANVEKEFEKVRRYWDERLGKYNCRTPSSLVDSAVNIWNQYQCHTTLNWSRSASFNEAGGRDGIGFRDTAQDTFGVVHSAPKAVRKRLLELLHGQFADGSAMHGFQPLTLKQGKHNLTRHIFSDDHLWLLLAVPAYLKETGDTGLLNLRVPFADAGTATVYEHLRRAIGFSWGKRGPHGLLLGLQADWNDCINLRGKGESMFSTFLYLRGLAEMVALAKKLGRNADAARFENTRLAVKKAVDRHAWDGDWFVRGYLDSGHKLGGKKSEQAKIFINSQTWAVLSGAVDKDKCVAAMDSLNRYLATEHGIVKNYPAYQDSVVEVGAITSFPAGLKENAGIFCHANTWAVVAEAMLGRGDRAFQHYLSFHPAAKNDIADVYTMEPYVYAQFITGKEHPYKFGRARNSWLTGTASWAFVAISQYVLGIRPDYDGLIVDPCIPSNWDGFEVTRVYRGATYRIRVRNPYNLSSGIRDLVVNGRPVPGNRIPLAKAGSTVSVEAILA